MTKKLNNHIAEILIAFGIDKQAKGYAHLVYAITLLIEEE